MCEIYESGIKIDFSFHRYKCVLLKPDGANPYEITLYKGLY